MMIPGRAAFCEKCQFKTRSQEVSIANGRRFHEGIFLGIDRRTGQYMLYSGDEVKLARTVVRVPEAQKWCKDLLAAVKLTPRSLHQPRATEFQDKVNIEDKEFADRTVLSRQVQLRASDFAEHQPTRGCPKCNQFLRRRDWKLTSGPHSAACRSRIEAELAKTPAGRIRLSAAASRLDRTVEELGQEHRDDLPQGELRERVVQSHPEQTAPPQIDFLPLPSEPAWTTCCAIWTP